MRTPPQHHLALAPSKRSTSEELLQPTLFHEHWWLKAVARHGLDEVTVSRDGRVVARLPFVGVKRWGFTILRMPSFTHVLGPLLCAGRGKLDARRLQRYSLMLDLIHKLPPFDHFVQIFEPEIGEIPAFQEHGFHITPQYTFRVDCRAKLDELWGNMRDKTRNVIRRAAESHVITSEDDPGRFVEFYLANLGTRHQENWNDFVVFPKLFAECKSRGCGELLGAYQSDGKPAAMVYIVWGHGVMYFLMSTRTSQVSHNGAVSLLVWEAMQRAHRLGLVFDLDGVISPATFRFLSGFGGQLLSRLIVRRSRGSFRALRYIRDTVMGRGVKDTFCPYP